MYINNKLVTDMSLSGFKKGDRVAQGLFHKFLITDDDNASGKRLGGIGQIGFGHIGNIHSVNFTCICPYPIDM